MTQYAKTNENKARYRALEFTLLGKYSSGVIGR
jgi:hypothetical protein